MSGASPAPSSGSVRPPVALAFALVGFLTLVIFGFGMTSLILDEDVVTVAGLGPLPGTLALLLSAGVFAGGLWVDIRRPRPSFPSIVPIALAAFLGYLAGLWLGALLGGGGPVEAFAAVGGVATSWFGLIVVTAALVAAWGGVALVRTRAERPRWPWEHDEDEG